MTNLNLFSLHTQKPNNLGRKIKLLFRFACDSQAVTPEQATQIDYVREKTITHILPMDH